MTPTDSTNPAAETEAADDARSPESLRRALFRVLHGGRPAPTRDAVPPAVVAARYEIGERLGKGGMGAVHRAFDRNVRRDVAVKFAPTGCPRGGDAALRDEVRTLAEVDHPAIPRALDTGEAGGFVYAVFPLVRGETLAARFAARRPTPVIEHVSLSGPTRSATIAAEADARPKTPTAAEIDFLAGVFSEIARALHALHRAGWVHADVKPANVMIDADGRPYLIDFGLATGAETAAVDAHGGTDPYMSPEQTLAHGGTLTPASDVYSLAVTFHEALTGRRVAALGPSDATSERAAIRRRVATAEVPAPSIVEPRLRDVLGGRLAPLEALLAAAVVKAPEGRYPTAAAFADDLDAWRNRKPLVHAADPNAARARSRRRRARLVAAAAAPLLIAAIAIIPGRMDRAATFDTLRSALAAGAAGDPEAFLRGFESALASDGDRAGDLEWTALRGRLVEAGAESVVEAAFLRSSLPPDDAADLTFTGRVGSAAERLLALDDVWTSECASRLAAAAAFAHLRAGRLDRIVSLFENRGRRAKDDERCRLLLAIALAKDPVAAEDRPARAARIAELVGDAFDASAAAGQHLLVASRLCCRATAYVVLATTPYALTKEQGRACLAALSRAREALRDRAHVNYLATLEALCLIADDRFAEAEARLRERLEDVTGGPSAEERPVVLMSAGTAAFAAAVVGSDATDRRLRRERALTSVTEVATTAPGLLPRAFEDMSDAWNALEDDEARARFSDLAAEVLDAVVAARPPDYVYDDRALRLAVLATPGWTSRGDDAWKTLRALADRFAAKSDPSDADTQFRDRTSFRRSFWINAVFIERSEPDDAIETRRARIERVRTLVAAAKRGVGEGGEVFDAAEAALELRAFPSETAAETLRAAIAALDRRSAAVREGDFQPFDVKTIGDARQAAFDELSEYLARAADSRPR